MDYFGRCPHSVSLGPTKSGEQSRTLCSSVIENARKILSHLNPVSQAAQHSEWQSVLDPSRRSRSRPQPLRTDVCAAETLYGPFVWISINSKGGFHLSICVIQRSGIPRTRNA